jgi:hypothetical protein
MRRIVGYTAFMRTLLTAVVLLLGAALPAQGAADAASKSTVVVTRAANPAMRHTGPRLVRYAVPAKPAVVEASANKAGTPTKPIGRALHWRR